MRNIVSLASVIGVATALFVPQETKAEFYVGASLGYGLFSGKNFAQASIYPIVNKTERLSGLKGGPLVGYRFQLNKDLFLDLESYADFYSYRKTSSTTTGATTLISGFEQKFTFGTAFNLGWRLEQYSPYLKIGVEFSEVKHKYNEPGEFSKNHRKSITAFAPGIGVERDFGSQLKGRLEYVASFYPAVSYRYMDATPSLIQQSLKRTRHDTFKVSLIYSF